MKYKQLSLYTAFILFIITCYQSPAFATGSTARAGLAQAKDVATKWKPDATLVQVLTLSGNADGTAGKWTYVFHSPSAKRGYQVAMRSGKVDNQLDVSASFTDALDPEFIDSTPAVAEAKNKGIKINGELMMMLLVMQKNTKNEGTYWNILGDMTAEMSMLINARTGKFYKEHKYQ